MNELFPRPRALSLSGPANSGLTQFTALTPSGNDGINHHYAYQLTVQTADTLGLAANRDLDSAMGQEITGHMEREGMGSFLSGMPNGSAGNQAMGMHIAPEPRQPGNPDNEEEHNGTRHISTPND